METLNTVCSISSFWQAMLTNPFVASRDAFRAQFSSDHSNVTHHFCRTFSLRYRSNNCYTIPVTQWQCICFVSLNFSVTQLLSQWSASWKTETNGSITMHTARQPISNGTWTHRTCHLWSYHHHRHKMMFCFPFPLLYFCSGFQMKYCSLFFISSSCNINNKKIRWWK